MNIEFALLAKYGDVHIPLEVAAEDYFGMEVAQAQYKARSQELPIPAYRLGSQKSPWFVNASDLAKHITARLEEAKNDWRELRS